MSFLRTAVIVLLALSPAALHAAAVDAELEDLQPGLAAHYRSLSDREATLDRIDAKPTFFLGQSSPHPRLPVGPFEVVWTGILSMPDTEQLRFDAFVSGELTMEVDGVRVLQGRGENETAHIQSMVSLNRPGGLYPLRIRYRSLAGRPSRLQIGWQSPAFSREPLPPWQLGHLPAQLPPTITQERLVDRGREAIGRLGCAQCHRAAFPGVSEPPPGPALAVGKQRIDRAWLLRWLDNPARVRPEARMPALFASDRKGFVERWALAEHLVGPAVDRSSSAAGNHRMGRRHFIGMGCAACHYLPDMDRAEQAEMGQTPVTDLAPRLPAAELAAFLIKPSSRYPDGRMPHLPVSADMARDLAAYLLRDSKPPAEPTSADRPPTPREIEALAARLGVQGKKAIGDALLREKRCAACHPGLGAAVPADVRLSNSATGGCISEQREEKDSTISRPHFTTDQPTRKAIAVYRAIAVREKHPSPFASRQRLIDRFGCVRCHQRDTDRPPPIEAIGSKLGGAWLQVVPFQRTPRLTYPHQKFLRSHLLAAVRGGISGLRNEAYTYRMPDFGADAEAVVRALAEGDGDLPDAPDPPQRTSSDPTLGPLAGPRLAGFQGYSCVSCHIWNGKALSNPDPGAVGTDLTRVAGRIRRDWFDRYLEAPARIHPNTPMPTIFPKGQPAPVQSVLDGDVARQKEALWSYFALGSKAPSPSPPPPMPVASPQPGEPPLVASIPIHLPDGKLVESICILYPSNDLVVFDLGTGALRAFYTGAHILREVQGRLRSFRIGASAGVSLLAELPLQLAGVGKVETPSERTFHGYDRLDDGARLRWQARLPSGPVEVVETLTLSTGAGKRRLVRQLRFTGIPAGRTLVLRSRVAIQRGAQIKAVIGTAEGSFEDKLFRAVLNPERGVAEVVLHLDLPDARAAPPVERAPSTDVAKIEGSRERPGYRAVLYPRPRTVSGEDRVMPGAVAVDPRNGRVFVASMKTGELFVLRDPTGDGRKAHFDNYARGLFEDVLSMHAEPDALYVLHRRSLTRVVDTDGDGLADRFERIITLPHGIGGTYDYAYGLARDREGAFIFSFAPYANTHLPGSGGALRLLPGRKPEEIATGFRNPLGWCSGPDGEIFFTDNQGEWVATNKLCHLVRGRYYGFPLARQQKQKKPPAKAAIWVPYAWAKSINGVTYDHTGGKFGPFAGQLFLAELMFGGAIVRASLEKVNGEYQGACFPFWGPGLLGPLTLAFDPAGRLWVGSITEPGWMAQPDRGALFRIDFTGQTPFEMQTIRVLPHGFRIIFNEPPDPHTARDPASYRIEHYRYEYTGAYGSPELDRASVPIERVELSSDGRHVDLTTAPLVKDRVYLIQAPGLRSRQGKPLVHPAGAYTLNEIPTDRR